MVWNLEELTDLLLNHPSSWRIPEMIRYNPEKLGAVLLEAQAAEMKHSILLNFWKNLSALHAKNYADVVERCNKLSSELGKERLKNKGK